MRRLLFIFMMLFTGSVYSAQPQEGDIAIVLENPFDGRATYSIGYHVSPAVMPYASISLVNQNDSVFMLGGGSRFYQTGVSDKVRTFFDADLRFVSDGRDGFQDQFRLGGYFGAEASIGAGFTVSGRLGATYTNFEDTDNLLNFGTTDVMINYYF